MDELIDLPVIYKGETLLFTARVLAYGYVYKLSVEVDGTEVLFEPDEQGGYRAVLASPDPDVARKINKGMIEAVAETLASLRNS